MAEVVYVRNTRPNAVLIRPAGVTAPIAVERRGSREDTAAIPGDWLNDPTVSTFFQKGILERINKEAFLALGERREGRPAYALRQNANEIVLPMADEESRTPTVIANEVIDTTKHLRTPNPEFAERVLSTEEELSTGIRQPLPAHKKRLAPVTKEERLETKLQEQSQQISDLTNLVTKMLEAQTVSSQPKSDSVYPSEEEVAPKKAAKPRAKSTRTKKS